MKKLSLFRQPWAAMAALAAAMAAVSTTSCDTIDNERIPPVNVNIVFNTIGDWETYGVAGASNYQRFIASEHQPANFPYKGLEGTGYGGVLLLADPLGEYLAYDLACPVCAPTIQRIVLDTDSQQAGIFRCTKCGSTYDVFAMGTPRSGAALQYKYGLERYRVLFPRTNPYALITR